MKGITYKDLVDHYGLSVCDNESGCVYSWSTHRRGRISHWRGDVMHWYMDRNVTRPGLLMFLRAIARDRVPASTADPSLAWRENIANECMWAQREAQEQWKLTLPLNVFRREKSWITSYFAWKKKDMTIDDYMSPMYLWATTHEEEK